MGFSNRAIIKLPEMRGTLVFGPPFFEGESGSKWNTSKPLLGSSKTTAGHPPGARLGIKKGVRHFGFLIFSHCNDTYRRNYAYLQLYDKTKRRVDTA
jgi:hypothetical protein